MMLMLRDGTNNRLQADSGVTLPSALLYVKGKSLECLNQCNKQGIQY